MSAIYVTRNTVFSATTGAKTVLKLITPTSFSIRVLDFAVSTDGVTATAVPATLDLFISDETTAGTNVGTAVTTQVQGEAIAHGLTVGQNMSAEGTTYTVIRSWFLPQFMGLLHIQDPLGQEATSPAGNADSIGLRINTTATVNVLASIKWCRT